MRTKVKKRNKIPAGILSGVEIFTDNGIIYGLENGSCKPFLELPSSIKNSYKTKFMADRQFHRYAKQYWNLVHFDEVFYKWMDCAFGNLDGTPDLNEATGEIIRDENSWCGDYECKMAGTNCTLPHGLKMHEIETLSLFKKGLTANQVAKRLHRSKPAIISRIEKTKVNLEAINMAHLSSITPLV